LDHDDRFPWQEYSFWWRDVSEDGAVWTNVSVGAKEKSHEHIEKDGYM